MKIAILGSGNGGCAAAADWALAGHQVRLFDFEQFDQNIAKINAQQGIHADGDVCGFAKLDYAGHSIQYAMEGADMILAVTYAKRISTESCSLIDYPRLYDSLYVCGVGVFQIPIHMALIIVGTVSVVVLMVSGASWDSITSAIEQGGKLAWPPLLLLYVIGMMVGIWVASGTVPFIIYWGPEAD